MIQHFIAWVLNWWTGALAWVNVTGLPATENVIYAAMIIGSCIILPAGIIIARSTEFRGRDNPINIAQYPTNGIGWLSWTRNYLTVILALIILAILLLIALLATYA